ncbi:hypothetical protein AX15_000781 [Amanita polypyramis BW_CC]|nr:hypothetical protein AX15_000781 [Amanita polypyramis BW_CC]
MPTLTITIEDNSPLLTYNGWIIGASNGPDSLVTSYSERNFMGTSSQNTTMTFQFTGMDVMLYGAQRGNHGNYQVSVDNQTHGSQNGYAPDPGNFQVLLFESHGTDQGDHVLTITNLENKWLDIDFVTWTAAFGDPNAKLAIATVDDNDGAFKYSGSDWSTSPTDVGKYFGGTGHTTMNYNATVEFAFSIPLFDLCAGDAISLYGPVGSNGAPYNVQIDDKPATSYQANRSPAFQMLLYHANNLGSGNHTLTFTCQPVQQQLCGIDYVNIYSTATNGSSAIGATSPNASNSNSSHLSAGDIVGIVLGSAALLVAIGAAGFYIMLRKKGGSLFGTQRAYSSVDPSMTQPSRFYD